MSQISSCFKVMANKVKDNNWENRPLLLPDKSKEPLIHLQIQEKMIIHWEASRRPFR